MWHTYVSMSLSDCCMLKIFTLALIVIHSGRSLAFSVSSNDVKRGSWVKGRSGICLGAWNQLHFKTGFQWATPYKFKLKPCEITLKCQNSDNQFLNKMKVSIKIIGNPLTILVAMDAKSRASSSQAESTEEEERSVKWWSGVVSCSSFLFTWHKSSSSNYDKVWIPDYELLLWVREVIILIDDILPWIRVRFNLHFSRSCPFN